MENELKLLDIELMTSASPSGSEELFKKYEDLKTRLNEEMSNWTIYSHEVDEFLKNSS
jgi:hypothetical protein